MARGLVTGGRPSGFGGADGPSAARAAARLIEVDYELRDPVGDPFALGARELSCSVVRRGDVDAALEAVAGGAGTARGSGGMASKLAAAKIAAWLKPRVHLRSQCNGTGVTRSIPRSHSSLTHSSAKTRASISAAASPDGASTSASFGSTAGGA